MGTLRKFFDRITKPFKKKEVKSTGSSLRAKPLETFNKPTMSFTRKKHPLHSKHFGNYAPCKPIR